MRQLKNYSKPAASEPDLDALSREALSRYGGMGEDELLSALLKSVTDAKKNGTYDSEQMLAFMNTMAPHLNDAQKEKLARVISVIDGDGR